MTIANGTSQHKAPVAGANCAVDVLKGASQHKAPVGAALCAENVPRVPGLPGVPATGGRPSDGLSGALCSFPVPSEGTDAALANLARRQHWCLHRLQLNRAGLGAKAIRGRTRRGELERVLPEVYLFGRADPAPLSFAMAAALTFRGTAVVAGGYAAWIWEMASDPPAEVGLLHVGSRSRAPRGIGLHRVSQVDPDDVRWRRGIPITSPARTFCDFTAHSSLPLAESALATLRRRSPKIDAEIHATLGRLPINHPGAGVVRRLLELPPAALILTKSVYERRLRELLCRAGLPAPDSNQMIAGHERDLIWRGQKLIVEFDGWEFHRHRFREDRARDAAAVAACWRVIRITADRVDKDALRVIAEIAAALSAC